MSSNDHRRQPGRSFAATLASRLSGLLLCAAFYGLVIAFPIPMVQRYFMGHPICIATTILFCLALAQLVNRYLVVLQTQRQCQWMNDGELLPASLQPWLDHSSSSADTSYKHSPVTTRIADWSHHLTTLPAQLISTPLVQRLIDALDRQQRRGNASHLADDMRDLADRDADNDHDQLQFVRILVWAIPMLGFLGTVVGITETLGGLDFSDGATAVNQLKSGLYVAFDTTALGLVLSVLAIFLQFPVERNSRLLLESVDSRAGRLLPLVLAETQPLDREDPLRALHQLTQEIMTNIQSSIQTQAEIWRQSIDAAHVHWHSTAAETGEQLRAALHDSLGTSLSTALRDHAEGLRRVQREGVESIDNRWQQWQTVLSDNARILLAHQKTLLSQGELLADTNARARELDRLQNSLDHNITKLDETLSVANRGLQTVVGTSSLAEAMMTLARAVDVLAQRMEIESAAPISSEDQAANRLKPRRHAA